MVKLDLACGQTKKEGFVGVDIQPLIGVDVVCDLEVYPWPFPDDSVDEIYCSHYFEHTTDPMKFMNELYRIMKKGAKGTIMCPYYTSIRAWQDPTHKRAISEASFIYYNKEWREINQLTHYPITCDFDISIQLLFTPEWATRSPDAQKFAVRHYWNVIYDIAAEITKR